MKAFARYNISIPEGRYDFRFPDDLRDVRIAGAELQQWARHNRCPHTLDIRDRHVEGKTENALWLQQDPVSHRCAARYLLPVVGAILRERHPNVRVANLEGTIVLSRRAVTLPELVSTLVRELPPYLNIDNVALIYQVGRNSPQK